jgi:HK97 family phage major capsid protein
MAEGLQLTGDQSKELLAILGEFKTSYAKLSDDCKTLGSAQSSTLEKLDKLTDDVSALHKRVQDDNTKRIDALEASMTRQTAQLTPAKSVGDQVIEDPAFMAAIKAGGRIAVTVSVKGPLFAQKDITMVSQSLPQVLSVIAAAPRLPIGVRTLCPTGRTTAGAVEYVQETSFTNNAATVAEAAAKPKSDKVFTTVTQVARTIAHYFKVSKQTFDDLPFISAQIESNGVYGVQKAEDNQLLNGTGVAPNLTGFMQVAVAAPTPPAASTGATLIDAIGLAVFDLAAKGYTPDGTVINPADWGKVALFKSTQGNYLFANPMDYMANARLWGTRVVATSSMAASNFLVGSFTGHCLLVDREDVNVQVATQNEDDFIKNMYTILVEERLALCIFNPAAFEKGVPPVLALEAQASPSNEETTAKRR